MHTVDQKILNKFKREPQREISTTELVREAHQEEYAKINQDLLSPEKKTASNAKRKKGQLHRKTLYHLNNLVHEGILKVSSIKGKGEKHFSLTIDHGELVFSKKNKQIVITKSKMSTSLIEEYESKGIVYKIDSDNWINKINCIVINCKSETGINKLYTTTYNCYSQVNDCICLYSFEHSLDENTEENISEILGRMNLDTRDYDRVISLVINISEIKNQNKIVSFITSYASLKPKNINLVFRGTSKDLKEKTNLFKKVSEALLKEEIKLNIQNTRVHTPPIIIGKAGIYTLRENEWTEEDNTSPGTVISNVSIAVDINNAYKEGLTTQAFREMLRRIAKTLLRATITQTRRNWDLFKGQNISKKRMFQYQKSYIRFWNYDLDDKKQQSLPDLLESVKEYTEEFCKREIEIYNACGLPIHFDIVLSSVFNKLNIKLSTRNYKKTTIRHFRDFQEQEIELFIRRKEIMSKTFKGGDRTRFFRKGDFKPEDTSKELSYLMNTYDLPLITYDFKETKGEMKLTNFMQISEE